MPTALKAALPTLRRKVLRSFSLMVAIYGGLGVFLVFSVFLAAKTTPKLLHVNYDSIAASQEMRMALTALDRPSRFPEHPFSYWLQAFEKSLAFAKSNITEPGEKEIVDQIEKSWFTHKEDITHSNAISLSQFTSLNQLLGSLVAVNEQGMFSLAEENARLSRHVLSFSVFYFVVTLVLALFLADGLSVRISRPLKNIAEALQRRPEIGKRLKMIQPNTLEVFILSNELEKLWEQVLVSQRLNVNEIIQQKTKLETVLESVEDALLVVNTEGQVAHCNSCMLSMLGTIDQGVLGQSWNDLSSMNENYLKLRAILRSDMNETEIDLLHKGSEKQFNARARSIAGASGLPIATLYLLHDVTELKQRAKFRADFIDLLSHEIKTPLQSLGTASEFLLENRNDLPQHIVPFAETISEDVERIRAVANEFVQLTQSHSKVMKLNIQVVAVNQCLSEWIKPFKIVAKDANVTLDLKQEGSQTIWANVDTVKFPWVISNLVSNAVRFSPSGGKVEVVLTDRNGSVEIRVLDEGPGISAEDQKRMYEPFYQSQSAMNTGRQGLFGVGLTITKEIVEAHDGRTEYHTRKPHGSEFRVLLPFPTQNYA